MTREQLNKAVEGLYRVYWKGGTISLAAVGTSKTGDKWMAACNWVGQAGPLTNFWTNIEMLFTQLHLKQDDSMTNGPSFCLVFDRWDPETNKGIRVYAQVSIERLNRALAQFGYTLYQP